MTSLISSRVMKPSLLKSKLAILERMSYISKVSFSLVSKSETNTLVMPLMNSFSLTSLSELVSNIEKNCSPIIPGSLVY